MKFCGVLDACLLEFVVYSEVGQDSRRWQTGAYLGFCKGGCTYLADLPPPPPDLDPDPDPHQDFELDADPDLHQNNADPQPWAKLAEPLLKLKSRNFILGKILLKPENLFNDENMSVFSLTYFLSN
jgi:hypothetical protein